MSSSITRAVGSLRLSPATKRILTQFALVADDEGISCISIHRIAERSLITYDTARYHIRRLKGLGYLVSVARRAGASGKLAEGTQVSNGWKVVRVWDGETPEAAAARLAERDPCSAEPSLFGAKLAPEPAPLDPDEKPIQAEAAAIVRQATIATVSRGGPVENSTPVYMKDDYISTGKRKTLTGKKKKTEGDDELERLKAEWNRRLVPRGYPKLIRITAAFRKKCATRAKEPGFSWGVILRILEDDRVRPFFQREDRHPSGWITAQWVVNGVSNYERIISGKYHLVGTDIDDDLELGDWAEASEQAKSRRVNMYAVEREIDG